MAAEAITEQALTEKIMAMLTARASCIDARSVFLEPVTDTSLDFNWRIAHFDYGKGDRYLCKIALRAIHEELRGQFHLADAR